MKIRNYGLAPADRDQAPGALIVGGHFLSLGAARNLASAGVPVWVIDSEACVSQFSRCVEAFRRCPPPSAEAGLVDFLLDLSSEAGLMGWVLFSSTDESVRLLSMHHERLARCYRLTLPPWDVVRHFYDKRLTHELARRQGVPMPWTWTPDSAADLAAQVAEFPVVLKPAISTHLSSVTKKKAYRADDPQTLLATYSLMASILDPAEILVQELIPGRAANLFSYFGLFQHGQPVTGYAAHRLRQHPMEFGRASTFAVTVEAPELEALATRLMDGVHYSGLAEVEFMYDPRDRRFELLEVNPRIWGWHTLAAQAGVNLPHLAYAQALGQPVSAGRFRSGVKWMRLLTDIPTVALEIRHGDLSLGDYLASVRGARDAVFSLRDPLPFLMEFVLIPYYAKHRGF